MGDLPVDFLLRFLINALVLLVLLRAIYFRFSPVRDSLFGFFLFGHAVYVIGALLHDVEISMGFAFGLFAVLSMLRYRTESISIRDMTYLFVVIVMSLLAAVGPISVVTLALLLGGLTAIVAVCETSMFAPRTVVRTVQYDSIDSIQPEQAQQLKLDLQTRLGIEVLSVEIKDIDFLKDSVTLKSFFALHCLPC